MSTGKQDTPFIFYFGRLYIIFVIPFASLKAQTSYEKMLYLSTI